METDKVARPHLFHICHRNVCVRALVCVGREECIFYDKSTKRNISIRQNYLKQHCGKYESNLWRWISVFLKLDIFPINKDFFFVIYIYKHRKDRGLGAAAWLTTEQTKGAWCTKILRTLKKRWKTVWMWTMWTLSHVYKSQVSTNNGTKCVYSGSLTTKELSSEFFRISKC